MLPAPHRLLVHLLLCCPLLVRPAPGPAPLDIAFTPEPVGPASRRSPVVISEIHYNPGPRLDGLDTEFVEIRNTEPFSADISGFRLSGEVAYTFPPGTVLGPTGLVVVARNPVQLEAATGLTGVLGPYAGSLGNDGGNLRLRHRNRDAILFDVTYNDRAPWPVAADGAGSSLVLQRPSFGMSDPRAWGASSLVGGSPGQPESVAADALDAVEINEIAAGGFVELFNRARDPIDLSGCALADAAVTNQHLFAPGTTLAGGAYLSVPAASLPFPLTVAGGRILLFNPAATRVLDARVFDPTLGTTAHGVTGSGEWAVLASPTPAAANAPRERPVVITEIHFHPMSDNPAEEWIELHNPGALSVDLDGWRLDGEVSFTFPPGVTLPADGRLVVAASRVNMLATYPAVSPALIHGDWLGTLSNRGGIVQLERPFVPGLVGTPFVRVDEVAYEDGGAWPSWADGGGSTLERRDVRGESSTGSNWAASNETLSAGWTLASATNLLQLGTGTCEEIQIIAAGTAEILIDDLVVRKTSDAPASSRVANGGFEVDLAGWTLQGNHITSHRQAGGFGGSAGSLRLVSTGSGDNGVNRVESDLTAPLTAGDTVEISCRARWLRGNPRLLLRLGGNWMELPVQLPATTAPGTPSAPNGSELPNAGPALSVPFHHPVLPAEMQDTVITVHASDPDGVASISLSWRADPATNLTVTTLHDDGLDPDRLAGDGEYSGFLPGQTATTLVAWHLTATDTLGATTRWPDSVPREALVRFGEPAEPAVIPSLRVWMTADNLAEWQSRQKLSNEALDCTVVHAGARVIHGAGVRYRGSALIRPIYAGPTNAASVVPGYRLDLPADEALLGSLELNLDGLEQPSRDDTLQRERMTYKMAESLGGVFPNSRYTRFSINGWSAGKLVADIQQADGDFLDQWYRGSDDGSLFELNYWFEFNDNAQVSSVSQIDATFQAFTNQTGQLHLPRYRWCVNKKNHGPTGDDHTPVFSIVDALNATNSPTYQAQVEAALDVPQFLHTIALRRIVNDWDGYGFFRGKNAFLYAPPAGGPASLTLWDLDFALGAVGGRPPTFPLFDQIQDPVLAPFFQHPAFRHAFFTYIQAAVDGPLASTAFNALADEHHSVLTAAGISAASPTAMKSWAASRRSYLVSQLTPLAAPFAITTNGGVDFSVTNDVVTLSGTAPVGVAGIALGVSPLDAQWITVTNWTVQVSLFTGVNLLTLNATDLAGDALPGLSDTITVTTSAGAAPPTGRVALTELHYHPPDRPGVAGTALEFLELKNFSPDTVDLGGTRLTVGIEYTFPAPTLLPPGGFVVLVADPAAFAAAYPWVALSGAYGGQLSNGGERITWLDASGLVLFDVTYDDVAPWPLAPDGAGPSLVPVTASAAGNPATAAYWRASTMSGGSPGRDDPDPAITSLTWITQPVDTIAAIGGPALFFAAAEGAPGLSYQWSRDGADLPGAVYPSLAVGPVAALDYGAQFRCRVSVTGLQLTSDIVTLNPASMAVAAAPQIQVLGPDSPPGVLELLVQGDAGAVLRVQESGAVEGPVWTNFGQPVLGTGAWQSMIQPMPTNTYRVYRAWSVAP